MKTPKDKTAAQIWAQAERICDAICARLEPHWPNYTETDQALINRLIKVAEIANRYTDNIADFFGRTDLPNDFYNAPVPVQFYRYRTL